MSDTPVPSKPKPKSEKAATELPPTQLLQSEETTVELPETQPLQSENVDAEPLENQPLQSEQTAAEPLPNTSVAEPSESEPPAVKQPQTKLEKLLKDRQDLDKRIKEQLAKEATEKRKHETRQKVLIGAAVQKQISKGKLTQTWLLAVLDTELTLEHDRKVFNLPAQPATKSAQK